MCGRRTAYQSTSLPFVPGIVTRTMSIPPLGDLHHLYPETFGGVSISDSCHSSLYVYSSSSIIILYVQCHSLYEDFVLLSLHNYASNRHCMSLILLLINFPDSYPQVHRHFSSNHLPHLSQSCCTVSSGPTVCSTRLGHCHQTTSTL